MFGIKSFRFIKRFAALALLLTAFTGAAGAQAKGYFNGAVYVLTNQASGNSVAVFDRANDGTLTAAGTVATGGLGTGSGLGSQGAVVLSKENKWLFAVNAGSNDISVFSVDPAGLTLADGASSGGVRPISVTSYKDRLYVLNAGGAGNITGFYVGGDGQLTPIPGSTQPLSGNATGPAQVQFSPDGRWLAVTEKATNMIDIYPVGSDGVAGAPITSAAAGTTPFGFAFGRNGRIYASEAFGGAPLESAASSYTVNEDGTLATLSGSVPTHQTAACWLAISKDERYAYTTNAGSGSISGYSIAEDGTLSLLNPDGVTGVTGPGSSPIDVAVSHNGHFLYALTAAAHGISAFAINADGSLSALPGITGLPVGTIGLASR